MPNSSIKTAETVLYRHNVYALSLYVDPSRKEYNECYLIKDNGVVVAIRGDLIEACSVFVDKALPSIPSDLVDVAVYCITQCALGGVKSDLSQKYGARIVEMERLCT